MESRAKRWSILILGAILVVALVVPMAVSPSPSVQAVDTYTLTVKSAGCCTVTVDGVAKETPYTGDYEDGTEVVLEALPVDPCCFHEWKVDGVSQGTDNPITVTMNADHTAIVICQEPDYGDANEDCAIDVKDYSRVKLIILGKKPEVPSADANVDCVINVKDYSRVKLIILGKKDATPRWYKLPYQVTGGDLTMKLSVMGMLPPMEITNPSPPASTKLWIDGRACDGKRAVFVPSAQYSAPPVISRSDLPIIGDTWTTISLAMTRDAQGTLFTEAHGEAAGYNATISSETDAEGTTYTYSGGCVAGDLVQGLPLWVETYMKPGTEPEPDPEDPTTWGVLQLEMGLDMQFTTATSTNEMVEGYLVGYIVTLDGDPAEEDGGAIVPYVGTDAILVSTLGLIGITLMGFDTDVQVESTLIEEPQ